MADAKYRVIAIPAKREKEIFLFLTCTFAFSIPFAIGINSVISILLFVFWAFFSEKKFEAERIKTLILVSILFWIALIGLLYTQNMDEGLFRVQQKMSLLLLPLVLGTVSLDWKKELKWIATFFLLGVIVACLVCLTAAIVYAIRGGGNERFFSHELTQVIDLYPYVLAFLCLSAVLVLVESMRGKIELHRLAQNRVVAAAGILFLSVFIFLLSVKQILLAWIFFALLYSILFSPNKRTLFGFLTAGVLLVVLAVFFIPTLKTKVNEVITGEENTIPLDQDASLGRGWNGIAMRKAVWTCSLDAINKNLWFGAGTGDGQDELQKAYENRQFYFASRYNRFNTHNQYLQTLVNFGIVGLVLWVTSLVWLIRIYKSNTLALYLLGSAMFIMLTESMLETNKGILAMIFVLTVFSPALANGNRTIKTA